MFQLQIKYQIPQKVGKIHLTDALKASPFNCKNLLNIHYTRKTPTNKLKFHSFVFYEDTKKKKTSRLSYRFHLNFISTNSIKSIETKLYNFN